MTDAKAKEIVAGIYTGGFEGLKGQTGGELSRFRRPFTPATVRLPASWKPGAEKPVLPRQRIAKAATAAVSSPVHQPRAFPSNRSAGSHGRA